MSIEGQIASLVHIATFLIIVGVLAAWAIDAFKEKDQRRLEHLIKEERELRELRARLRADLAEKDSLKASQRSLARMGHYKGPLSGPAFGVAGAHHREAMDSWAKDVWAGIRGGAPGLASLKSKGGVHE
jgi:hypothetical protein